PEEGQPVQVVLPTISIRLDPVDLRHHPAPDEEIRRRAQLDARTPYDLENEPPFRAALLRCAPDDHALLLGIHHIAAAGWSEAILYRELGALYDAFSAELPSPLPELPIQYADFAAWQRGQGEAELEASLVHWRRRLEGAPALLELPSDRPRPAVPTFGGATVGAR